MMNSASDSEALKSLEHYDFVIIGAGIAGASAAYELAPIGSVLIIEREQFAGYHATGRSAALYVQPYGNPTVRALTRASFRFLYQPPDGFASHPLMAPRGCMYIARDGQLSHLRSMAESERQDGYEFCRLSRRECVGRVPILRSDYVSAGLLDPTAMDIDVHALHQGYLRGAQNRGGKLVKDAEVVGIESRKGAYVVKAAAAEYETPVLVNAAGAWSDLVARLAGVTPLGLEPLRRTAMILDPPSAVCAVDWPLVVDVDHEFYFKPEAGKLLASPANESPSEPCDAQPDELDIAQCADRIEKSTTLSIGRIARSWAGLRTFAHDRSPVVGFDPGSTGFFWLAGQGGYGVQTSPAIARLAAALLNDLPVPEDLSSLGLTAAAVAPNRISLARATVR